VKNNFLTPWSHMCGISDRWCGTFEPHIRLLSYLGAIQRYLPKVLRFQQTGGFLLETKFVQCNELQRNEAGGDVTTEIRIKLDSVLIATNCNSFSALSTFKLYTVMNRHKISKHQKGTLLATTNDDYDSILTIPIF